MSGLEISSFVHLGWKKGKRAEARFLFVDIGVILNISLKVDRLLMVIL